MRSLVVLLWMMLRLTASGQEVISIPKGGDYLLQLEEIALSVDIAKGGIVEVSKGRTSAHLIVLGKKFGQTTIEVKLQSGKKQTFAVRVTSSDGIGDLDSIRSHIAQLPGLTSRVRNGKVYLEGKLRTRKHFNRLAEIKGSYPGLIVDGTVMAFYESNTVLRTINRVLKENDLGNFQAHSYGRILALEGSAKDSVQRDLALRIARMIYPTIEDRISRETIGAPSISIEVVFIEVQRKDGKAFGLPGVRAAFGGASSEAPTDAALAVRSQGFSGSRGRLQWQIGSLGTFLQLIQERSVSRVLSNPRLVARSGEAASFHSGLSFFLTGRNVDSSGAVTETHNEVKTGIELEIKPKIDAIGQIDSQVSTSIVEVSDEIAGKPSLAKSKVSTAVTINNGQTLMLSGLVRKRNQKRTERVPLLSDIPIVGELFKSRRTRDEETELLVLVTMTRVEASSEKLQAARQLWKTAEEDVEVSIFD